MLGMASDGGWWVLGVAEPATASVCSTSRCRDQYGRCNASGPAAHWCVGNTCAGARDVDTVDDIVAVRNECGSSVGLWPPLARRESDMLGQLYEEALGGERCWLRHDDGRRHRLPVHSGSAATADQCFDHAVVELCQGPTIDLGCGPGRLVTHLIQRGFRRSVSTSPRRRCAWPGAAARRSCCGTCSTRCRAPAGGRRCCWPTATSASAATLAGAAPRGRTDQRDRPLRRRIRGRRRRVRSSWVRLESSDNIGPWFRWARSASTTPRRWPGSRPRGHRNTPDRRPGCGYTRAGMTTP